MNILFPVLILGITNFAQFWRFYVKGLLPFPGDLLVSFFYPWFSGGFPGFNPWTTHKEDIASDALRALFPWRLEAMRQIFSGHLPLWNPYNFSGTPLLANLQSAVFFPGNVLFFLLPPMWAWIILVLLSLSVFGFFSYLFLRSQKLSRFASLLGAIVISNITYLVNWHELLVITQTVLFLPLALWAINRHQEKSRKKYLVVLILSLVFTIFGGHIQTALYVYLIIFLFALFRHFPKMLLLACFVLAVGLSAVQLAPAFELYRNSAREGDDIHQLFADHIFPTRNLITILAPDFYGNPVTQNFWSTDYHNSLAYFGIVALTFALFALVSFTQKPPKEKRAGLIFFLFLGIIGVLFSISPLVFVFDRFRIPVFSTGVPARTIFLFLFSAGVLSAYGAQFFLDQENKLRSWPKLLTPIAVLGLVYAAVWLFVLRAGGNYLVSRSNLILPTGIFLVAATLIILSKFFRNLFWFFAVGLLLMAIFEHSRYFNKISPFAPKAFFFPNHPVLSYLQKNAGINRFFGVDKAYFERNFATYYQIFEPDGYDPLYTRRYGELIATSHDGKMPHFMPRADAVVDAKDSPSRNRLLDILGTKYLLDVDDSPNLPDDKGKFSPDLYKLVWRQSIWRVYQRLTTLPRAFLVGEYEVINNDKQIISRLYDPTFAYKDKIILEENPNLSLSASASGSVNLISSAPNLMSFKTQSAGQKLLFLSDTNYPGWEAFTDTLPVKIYRADYTFRAVPVPSGIHTVTFRYNPASFKIGILVTLVSLISSLGFLVWLKEKG